MDTLDASAALHRSSRSVIFNLRPSRVSELLTYAVFLSPVRYVLGGGAKIVTPAHLPSATYNISQALDARFGPYSFGDVMRLWLLSDLHQEFVRDPAVSSQQDTVFDPALHAPSNFDIVVLAGDVDVPLTRSLTWIAERFSGVPTIAVAGNHEFYTAPEDQFTMTEMRRRGADLAGELGIHLLDDSSVTINDVRFVGGTLWTDFALGGGNILNHIREAEGRHGMWDYKSIKRESTKNPGQRRHMRAEHSIAAHQATREYVRGELARPWHGATIVVTHHAPHGGSLAPDKRMPWCYASNLSSLLIDEHAPEHWFHGHIHTPVNYKVGRTQIRSNPRGYRFIEEERRPPFDPGLVIEVGK